MVKEYNNYRLLYLAQEGRCFYCDRPMNPRVDGKAVKPAIRTGMVTLPGWTRDHFNARANGHGLLKNVVLSCACCNGKKAIAEPTEGQRKAFADLLDRYDALRSEDDANVLAWNAQLERGRREQFQKSREAEDRP